jgi:hypothetical protein
MFGRVHCCLLLLSPCLLNHYAQKPFLEMIVAVQKRAMEIHDSELDQITPEAA